MHVSRPTFLAASAALFAAPVGLAAQPLTKIRVAGSPDQDIVGVLWAVQGGIFARYGLDVDVQKANSGAATTAAVVGGSLEFGKANVFSLIAAHARGVPLVLEAPSAVYEASAPSGALIVAKNAPYQSGRDLNGKTLGVPSLGDSFQIVNSAWIDQNGGDSRTVKFVELPAPAVAEAILAGRIDAATITEPLLTDSVRTGKCRILGYSQNAIAKKYVATAYFCTTDYAAKNADIVSRFRKALAEAAAYTNAHRAEMVPYIVKYTGLDEKTVSTMSPTTLATVFDPALIQPMIDAAYKYKGIPRTFSAKEMFDPTAPTV